MVVSSRSDSSWIIYLLIASSGFATLSWEVIWQIKAALALGVSAWGTAITLAVMMGGMSLGGFLMGHILFVRSSVQAIRTYGLLEFVIGLIGLFLNPAFRTIETLDTWAYTGTSTHHSWIDIFGIIAVLSIPTLCMGATLPVFALISRQFKLSLSKLYSVNSFGAAVGALIVALTLIPLFGITYTIVIIAIINMMIGFLTWLIVPNESVVCVRQMDNDQQVYDLSLLKTIVIVFVTGFATFTLEIAWFRSLETVFPNTTDVFAIMLACMLIALSLAAKNISRLKQNKKSLGTQLCLAGMLILLVTPLIERIDIVLIKQAIINNTSTLYLNKLLNSNTFLINGLAVFLYLLQVLSMFIMISVMVIPTMRYLGIAFPWILDNQYSAQKVGQVYAVNTLAAILGAIGTAWFLLPLIGFAKSSWLAGILVMLTGIWIASTRKRFLFVCLGIAALFIAIFFETGVGRTRVQGPFSIETLGTPAKILGFFEGPEATVSAIEYHDGTRILLINSVLAALESGQTYQPSIHYMAWMGHLPMLIQSNPKKALIICFGTGQTANAVRKENAQEIDIVDINPNIYKLAHHFRSNEQVLNDPRVKAIVMDGRAFMRRTQKVYDIITLEPMPPITMGANALYSKEFYELAKRKLASNGVIAQWLPFHTVSPHSAASIAKTFINVFPNAILWVDPDSKTGILLGQKDNRPILTKNWPGFGRVNIKRNLSKNQVQQSIALNSNELKQYAQYGEMITDDNQLLSYGSALYVFQGLEKENFILLNRAKSKS